ncbi:uncharacterized protein [Anabrus simplex]|uniref:uncharacterized protein isoform X2 n=1 Tax=Anabrus simplex TaxID=316456 RepID=UPI0035A3A86D
MCPDVLSGGDWRGRISNRQQHSTSQNRSVEGTTLQVNNAENVAVNTNPVVLKPDLYFAGNDVNANSSGSDLSLYSSNALVTKPERNVVESSRDKIDFLKRLRLLNENLDVTQEHKDKVSNKPFKKDMDCQTVITGDIISLNLHNLEDGDVVLTPTIETSYNENLMHLDCISLDDIQNIFINQGNVFLDYINGCGTEKISKSCVTVNDGLSATESVGRLSEGEGLQSANLVEPVMVAKDGQQEVEIINFVSSDLHFNDEGMGSSESISHLSNNETEEDLEGSCVVNKLSGNIKHGNEKNIQLDESLIMNCHNICGLPNKDEIEVDSMSNSKTMGDSNITEFCNNVTEHYGSESNIVSQNKSAYSRCISVQINRNACNSSDNLRSLQTIDNCILSNTISFHEADTNVAKAELLDNDFCSDFINIGSGIHSQNKSEGLYTFDAKLSDESTGNPSALHAKNVIVEEKARDVASLCKYCNGFNKCVNCNGIFQEQYNDFMLRDTSSTVGNSQIVTLPKEDPERDVNITELLDKVPSAARDQTEYQSLDINHILFFYIVIAVTAQFMKSSWFLFWSLLGIIE